MGTPPVLSRRSQWGYRWLERPAVAGSFLVEEKKSADWKSIKFFIFCKIKPVRVRKYGAFKKKKKLVKHFGDEVNKMMNYGPVTPPRYLLVEADVSLVTSLVCMTAHVIKSRKVQSVAHPYQIHHVNGSSTTY